MTSDAPSPLHVVVVDDEPPARQRIEDLLDPVEGVVVSGSYDDGTDAVASILDEPPDLVFLDVQMPEVTGLDVLRQVGPGRMPPVVFVTAYDRYALDAFEARAVDYLLKPYADERFYATLDRALDVIRLRRTDRLRADLQAVLLALDRGVGPEAEGTFARRLAVDDQGVTLVVRVDDVDYIAAQGAYAELHVGQARHLLREPMWSLEARLDPACFFRIHRSTIVNVDRIHSMETTGSGDAVVRLRSGVDLRVSRNRVEGLQGRLGF